MCQACDERERIQVEAVRIFDAFTHIHVLGYRDDGPERWIDQLSAHVADEREQIRDKMLIDLRSSSALVQLIYDGTGLPVEHQAERLVSSGILTEATTLLGSPPWLLPVRVTVIYPGRDPRVDQVLAATQRIYELNTTAGVQTGRAHVRRQIRAALGIDDGGFGGRLGQVLQDGEGHGHG